MAISLVALLSRSRRYVRYTYTLVTRTKSEVAIALSESIIFFWGLALYR